ncbi:MAG: radical SAM family heme chaperone HemW [Clostridia bacterium]|nr:radical SAM family heme chaperone HemW [Clostridia bacterium]
MAPKDKKLGIYVHFPFCVRKCSYCDFYSASPVPGLTDRYIEILRKHAEMLSRKTDGYSADTVFFGGGTPTLAGGDGIKRVTEILCSNFNIEKGAEFTVEANPGTVDRNMLSDIRSAGVNRISFGLQSSVESELRVLGRIHSYEDFLRSYHSARDAGFDNINVDIMYAVPGQTAGSFASTLERVTRLCPEHISCYALKLEKGTRLESERDRYVFPDEDSEFSMYLSAAERLGSAGYRHYEISNYALEGKECRHNLRYWDCREYIGLGPSAHSFFMGTRYGYVADTDQYMNSVSAGEEPFSEYETVTEHGLESEYVMLRLRLGDGISDDEFLGRFGYGFGSKYEDRIKRFIDAGMMKTVSGRYFLTDEGMYISNYIISELI